MSTYGTIAWRDEDSVEALASRYHHETAPDVRPRWHALLLLRQGRPRAEVVAVLDIHPRTLRDWIAWYRDGGCAAVASHHAGSGGGGTCRLTLDQQAEIAAMAGAGAFRTKGQVRDWVAETWGITYKYQGMQTLLDRLKIRPRVPRPVATTVDPVAQEAWKKGGDRSAAHRGRHAPDGHRLE